MLKDVSDVIGGFFTGLDLKRRWVILFVIFLLALIGLYVFEVFTGHFYYSSLERKVVLLEKLNELSKNGISSNPSLYPVFEDTVHELESKEIKPLLFNLPTKITFSSLVFWKTFSGSFIGLFFLLLVLLGLIWGESAEKRRRMIVGSIFLIIVGGFIGALLPVIYNTWVNYIGVPVVIFVSLFIIGSRMK